MDRPAGRPVQEQPRKFFQGLTARLAKAVRVVTANQFMNLGTDQSVLDLPQAGMHVWEWFWQIEAGRRIGQHGPEAFSFTDIDAWARLSDEEPRPWEVRALMAMDGERRDEFVLLTKK